MPNLEFLNLARGNEVKKETEGMLVEFALCIRSGTSSHELCTLVGAWFPSVRCARHLMDYYIVVP